MNVKKILGYALGPLGSAAMSAISLPLISWYFSSDDIGRIVLLQTISSLALIVLGLGLDKSYIREYHSTNNKASLLKTVFILPLILTLSIAAILGLFKPEWLSKFVLELENATLGLICLIYLVNMLVARFLSVILRMQERSYAFSFSQITPKILILFFILSYVLFGFSKDTLNLLLAYTIAQTITTIVLYWQTRSEIHEAWKSSLNTSLLKETLFYGIPLVFGGFAYWGLTSVDRFFLKQYSSLSELGVYSMAISFGSIALIFQSIFSTIWAPLVFRWVKEDINLDKINDIVRLMLNAITVILCLVGIFSPLIPFILPEKYAPVQFIVLSSILFPLLYTLTEVTGIGINVRRKTWLVTLISIVALMCNLLLCSLLIPLLDAKGAAMSTAISFWIFFALKTEASSHLWQKLPRFQTYGTTLICLLFSLCYTYWGTRHNYPLFAAIWLFTLFILIIKQKDQLSAAIQMVNTRLKKRS